MISDILSGTIPPRIQILALVASAALLANIINLIRREKLKEGYSIIWFFVGLAMVLFSALAGLLDLFASAVGIAYSPAALFLIVTLGLILLSVHFSVLISKHDRQVRELAQETALLKSEIRALQTERKSREGAHTLKAAWGNGNQPVQGAIKEKVRV